MLLNAFENLWNNRLCFDPVIKSKWWPDYLSVLKLFYYEKYQDVIDKIAQHLCQEDISGEFQLLLYRLWIEVLVLDPATSEDSSNKCLKLIRDHLQKISSACQKKITSEDELQDYTDSLSALVGLTHYYQDNKNECEIYLLNWQKKYKFRNKKNSYIEELVYKIENKDISNDDHVIHISSYDQYIKNIFQSKESYKDVIYMQSFDFITIQTLLAYTCARNYFSIASDVSEKLEKFYGKTPMKGMICVYQALNKKLHKDALKYAKTLTETYPSNISLLQLYSEIIQKQPQPSLKLKLSMELAKSAIDQDNHQNAVEYLNKSNQIYLKAYDLIDQSVCDEFQRLWDSIEKKWGFDKNHKRQGLDFRKGWMCFVSDETYLNFFDNSKDCNRPLLLSLEHEIRQKDWVCLAKKNDNDTSIIGLYTIEAALPFRFGLETNTVLNPIVLFMNDNRFPSINLPKIIDDRNDDQALRRRKFGLDISFDLGKNGMDLLLEEIEKLPYIEPSTIDGIIHKWKSSA